jgi:hypothetical protein
MPHGMRGHSRARRRSILDWSIESLEARALLSHGPGAADVASLSARHATTTMLQSSTKAGGRGQRVTLVATVRTANANRLVSAGRVRFLTVSPAPIALGEAPLNRLGQATLTTRRLDRGGTYQVEAQFIPAQRILAPSLGQITVAVTPPAVTAFRITAPQYFGSPGTPLTFSVTAVDRQNHPVTSFTGTIDLLSPTDHAAKFATKVYTFTTADQGTHTFGGGVTFHKGGAELLKVDQMSNTTIQGKARFGIQ